MSEHSEIVLCLTGDLLTCGEDWNLSEFGDLFQRLDREIDNSRSLRRYVRYFGAVGDKIVIRFFGTTVDSVTPIPDGMVSLTLSENEITVHKQEDGQPVVSWQSRLAWDWLDRSKPEFPTGEFTASLSHDWFSITDNPEVRFILSGNSYSQQEKMFDDDVHLVDYDPAWPDKFEEMANWLKNSISADIVLKIEHYGSTSIPGIPAKPIIDIILEIPSFEAARRILVPVFNKPGCEYWWYDDHMVFIIRDESTGIRTHHIHAAPEEHRVWEGLAFRDYLRTHPGDAQRYAALKYQLAKTHSSHREGYTDLKTDFVREITDKALKLKE